MIAVAKQPEFWQKVKSDPLYKPLLDDLWDKHEALCKGPIEALSFSEFMLFQRTGSRLEYERKFFARRGRMNTFALLYLIYGEKQYLAALEDTIWAICDEVTWEVPAHVWGDYSEMPVHMGLFACETGFAMSELLYLLGDQLNPMVADRMKAEINRRIIDVYMNHRFRWDAVENNWAAVCAGSVGAAFIYCAPEKLPIVLPRLLKTMDCFLRSFGEDGACREGLGYWTYGFGFFTHFADLLSDHTDGEIDLFQKEIVRKVAAFQHKVYLQQNAVVSVADGHTTSKCCYGLTNYLQRKYPGEVFMPRAQGIYDDDCFRWATFLRNFLWMDNDSMAQHEPQNPTYYYPHAQWYIAKKDKFAFAAKGGHNNEPHNHNDVGSFQLVHNGKQVLSDLGMGEYVKDYFGAKRYEFLVNSSRGHSVPIINGQYQQAGEQFCGSVLTCQDNVFELDIAKAYGVASLKSLTRRFDLSETGVEITDRYLFDAQPESVVHRLVFEEQPTLENGVLQSQGVRISFDPAVLSCTVQSESYYRPWHQPATCWLVDLVPLKLERELEIRTVITVA